MGKLRKSDVDYLKSKDPYYANKHYNKKTGEWTDKKTKTKKQTDSNFNKIKQEIIKRDGYRCVTCGQISNLEIHHVIYRSKGGEDEECNLITLCSLCHYKIHKGEPISKLMKSKLRKQGLIR